ncbi:uncharacterized protein LOC131426092 [Malaya genurostris]|uniref:uncharacterized protein LOC131426092 n=1 Tax=Malaya genurostris TaxID=325434 RepID=UPI0026F3C923|nr:uncharacterized protein LOC131426092 [Malaya genurostris]
MKSPASSSSRVTTSNHKIHLNFNDQSTNPINIVADTGTTPVPIAITTSSSTVDTAHPPPSSISTTHIGDISTAAPPPQIATAPLVTCSTFTNLPSSTFLNSTNSTAPPLPPIVTVQTAAPHPSSISDSNLPAPSTITTDAANSQAYSITRSNEPLYIAPTAQRLIISSQPKTNIITPTPTPQISSNNARAHPIQFYSYQYTPK